MGDPGGEAHSKLVEQSNQVNVMASKNQLT